LSIELGQLFTDGGGYSNAIFDAKTIVVMPGSYITAIPQSTRFGAAIALDATGGLLKNEMYWPNAERDALIPAHWAHKHNSTNHSDGGSLREVILANWSVVHDSLLNPLSTDFFTGVSGSGVVDNDPNYLRVRTGGTANSWARIHKGGANISFASKIAWRIKCRVNDDTSCLVRFGIDMESIENNADNAEKFGMEGCDGDGPQYRIVSANGIGRHKEPTPFNIEQLSLHDGYALIMEPGTTVTVQDQDGTELASVNNIPSTSQAYEPDAIKCGIKTTNTNEKILTIDAIEYAGLTNDTRWFQPDVTA
jgi:hypothetical protein